MGMLDLKMHVAISSRWTSIHKRLERLKSQVVKPSVELTSITATSPLNNGEIQPADPLPEVVMPTTGSNGETQPPVVVVKDTKDMPDQLYWAASKDGVDNLISVIEKVSSEYELAFSEIVQLVSPSGNTLLHVAAINACLENVKLLIFHAPALIMKQNLVGDTPLHLAFRHGHKSMVYVFTEFLCHRGDHFYQAWISVVGNIPEIEKSVRMRDSKGNTVLHVAVIVSCTYATSQFSSLDPEACFLLNKEGKSPLFLAAEAKSPEHFKYMLQNLKRSNFSMRRLEGRSPMLQLVQRTNRDLIDAILEYDPVFISFLDEDGKTPLHYAASTGKVDMIQYILGKKTEYASIRDKNGFLPIHVAAAHGNVSDANQYHVLCHNGEIQPADPLPEVVMPTAGSSGEIQPAESLPEVVMPTTGSNGETQPPVVVVKDTKDMPDELYWAASKDDVDNLISVIKKFSREFELAFSEIVQLVSLSGNTLLHVAVLNGCNGNVRRLIYHSPALIMKQNLLGDTPLHVVVRNGDGCMLFDNINQKEPSFYEVWIGVVGNIPEIRKSVRTRNSKGNTVLHNAVIGSCTRATFKFSSLDPEACFLLNNEGKSPLFLAAEAKSPEHFKYMLQNLKSSNFSMQRLEGRSPMLQLVQRTNRDLIDAILEYDPVFISFLDENGKTPLHYSASTGKVDMIQYILGKKTEYASIRDKNGFLPIHAAAAHGNVRAIKLLLRHCISPKEVLTNTGQNILHIAAACGKNNVVCFVLKTQSLECLLNEGDVNGNTPLLLATMNWQTKVVFSMTWDKRVDLWCANKQGFTPLDAAEYYKETPPSFDQRLTWAMLKASGAPQSPVKDDFEQRLVNPVKSQPSNTMETTNYRDRVNTLLVVATLVATVTFAAGFTMPGGFNNSDPNQGMATMLRNKAFPVFIFSDTVAMYTSILVVISLIWAQLGDINLVFIALRVAIPLLGVSLAMMSLAFVSGVYLVVSQLHWLAYTVLITGLMFLGGFLLLFVPLCCPITSSSPILRYLCYFPFQLLILVTSKKG